jgi:flavin-binding protein dodecin
VANDITVKPRVSTTDVQSKVENAFRRSTEIDARRISVVTQNGEVPLTGNVHSWAERREAMRAAWAAPGVTQVVDHLDVVPCRRWLFNKVIEVLSQSESSWEEAAQRAVKDAAKSVRHIKSIYIKNEESVVKDDKIVEYLLNANITFELEA